MATERELAAQLATALTGIAAVRWGWKALETAELPPTLPLVTITRTLASTTPYQDMCNDDVPLADTTLVVHVWVAEYEAARALNARVRGIVSAAGGWVLQSELDDYDGAFRAWRITGEYLGAGMTPE